MQFSSWQSVKVGDRAGVVVSASEYKKGKAVVLDVKLDATADAPEEVVTVEASTVSVL